MKTEITDERILLEKRSRYNPLLGLSPQSLRSANDAFKCGYLSTAARIWEEIEDSDGAIIAARSKRRKSVARLNWDIVPLSTASTQTAQAHAEILEDFYNNISWSHACDKHLTGGFSRLIESMLDAVGKRYSVNEIIWKPNPTERKLRAEFKFVPLYFFENTLGKLRLLKTPNSIHGEELKPNKWLIAATETPLMRASSVYFLMKNMSLADWLVFSRRFGSALAWLKTSAIEGSDKFAKMEDMLANIDNESSFMTGNDDTLTLLQVSGQNAPFREIIDHLSRIVVTMWLGSDLATLSAADAAGASLQGESPEMLEDDDCLMIEEALASTVSNFVIKYFFGSSVEPAAYLRFQRTDRRNKKEALDILALSADRGVAVSQKIWREVSGIPEPDANEAVIEKSQIQNQPINEFGANETDDINELAIARQKSIQPFLDELDRIETLADENEVQKALEKLNRNIMDFTDNGDAEAKALFDIIKRRIANEK